MATTAQSWLVTHSLSRSLNMQRQQKRGHNKGREYTPHNYFPPPKHQDNSLDGKFSAMASKIVSSSFNNPQFLLKFNITVVVFFWMATIAQLYMFSTRCVINNVPNGRTESNVNNDAREVSVRLYGSLSDRKV